ncbi:MAG: DUF1349 domain-containing protein [Dysgonomonas sp.]|nr:DUF1349 domain-containing protein [Dysgonomonas sp.]
MKKTLFLLFLMLSVGYGYAQVLGKKINAIPYDLEVYNNPVSYTIDNNVLEITALGKTNLINNPNEKSKVNNAPMILFEPEGDFTLSVKVSGDLKAIYDVAALVIYDNENTWAKLCYENSVFEEPTIVSVVTREFSDDCNSEKTGEYAYLAVVKKSDEYSFFYSQDRKVWKMIRHFNLKTSGKIKAGFAAHGSRGNGFTGIFSEIIYKDGAIDDMRDLN